MGAEFSQLHEQGWTPYLQGVDHSKPQLLRRGNEFMWFNGENHETTFEDFALYCDLLNYAIEQSGRGLPEAAKEVLWAQYGEPMTEDMSEQDRHDIALRGYENFGPLYDYVLPDEEQEELHLDARQYLTETEIRRALEFHAHLAELASESPQERQVRQQRESNARRTRRRRIPGRRNPPAA